MALHRHRVGGSWMALITAGLLLGAGHRTLHSQVVPQDIYTAEHERAPKIDQFYAEKFRTAAREEQEKFRIRIAIPEATGDAVPTQAALRAAQQITTPAPVWELPFWVRWLLILGAVLLVGVMVALRRFPDVLARCKDWLTPWDAATEVSGRGSGEVRVEAQAFTEFLATFRTGPTPRAVSEPALPPLAEFLTAWPRILTDLRNQLREVGNTADPQTRRRFLHDLGRELRQVRGETGQPELLPVWQMICALEGLVRQLAAKVEEVTPSTLRTVGGGLDLLAELCQPGLDAQLLTRRPVRLLAVDDDPISRHALSFALQRALHSPDLASGGETGLKLAREQAYDVIFLDVEMPDVDGFELCTQIHQTTVNRTTPVVFVTGQTDFDARVQATLSGGCDLIAKPFLTFELAVKALTLTMLGRLNQSETPTKALAAMSAQAKNHGVVAEGKPVVRRSGSSVAEGDQTGARGPTSVATDVAALAPMGSLQDLAPALPQDTEEVATEFLIRAPEHLGWVHEHLQNALRLTDEAAWLPMLSDVYLRLNAFTPDEKFAKGHPALQLSSALEKLLRKLLQNPTPPTKATMLTVTAAVELLRDLCVTVTPAVVASAPMHLLVVDDDPVARRALMGALQTTFEKPVCAPSGEAALALAAERKFDAIFLDVQMPGMDGIEAFARLRSEGQNLETPVVFVCGRPDLGPVTEISARGDCDIIAKPFLPAELLVKVLTLMLRRKHEPNSVPA